MALLGLDQVTMTVSLASSRVSLIILAMVITPEVSPALMASVPFASVKSVPDQLALPVITSATVTSPPEAAALSTVNPLEATDSDPL